jgi:hypothetical protein
MNVSWRRHSDAELTIRILPSSRFTHALRTPSTGGTQSRSNLSLAKATLDPSANTVPRIA